MTSSLVRVLSVVVFSAALWGCSRVDVELTHEPEFKELIGSLYSTKVEMGVVASRGSERVWVAPYGSAVMPPEDEVGSTFPVKYQGQKILGLLPSGSEFKTVRAVAENVKASGFIQYYVEIIKSSDPQWVGKVVNPMGLTTYDSVPQFKPEYVEEIESPKK